ncbi:MAG: hypothetical protein RIQ93_1482 [Verrucomicrobiota bacterium]
MRAAWKTLRILLVACGGVSQVHADISGSARDVPFAMQLAALPLTALDHPANPATPAKVRLGRLLFFDPILSATREVACATCHHPDFGWADGRVTPIGVDGVGLGPARVALLASARPLLERNALSIVNTGFNGVVFGAAPDPATAPMFWDSRVAGLETQALVPLRSHEEMRGEVCAEGEVITRVVGAVSAIPEYRELFAAAFGRPAERAVTADTIAQAVAVFERSLVAPHSAFDRFQRGDRAALTAEARAGLKVFHEAGSILCHGGPMFSDFKVHFVGATERTAAVVRTPTLRNLLQTAPYMHDGSLRTLQDVLRFYEALGDRVSETLDGGDQSAPVPLDPLLQRLNLVADDFPALEAFLRALNDDAYDRSVPGRVPSGLPVAGNAAARR